MGVTTSTVMLARVLGSSLGVAILGSVFTSTLLSGVERRLPGFPASDIQGDPHKVAALSDAVRTQVQDAFASSLASAFRIAVPLMLLLVVAVVALPGRRIRAKLAEVDADSVTEPMSLADAAAMGI
jgi:hypothetical protein